VDSAREKRCDEGAARRTLREGVSDLSGLHVGDLNARFLVGLLGADAVRILELRIW